MAEKELTNNKLARFFSMEIVGSMAIMAFTVGATYATLAAGQEKTDERVKEIEQKQKTIERAVIGIQTDTAILRNEQQHIKEDLLEQKQDIKRVLQILERNSLRWKEDNR